MAATIRKYLVSSSSLVLQPLSVQFPAGDVGKHIIVVGLRSVKLCSNLGAIGFRDRLAVGWVSERSKMTWMTVIASVASF